MTALLALQRTLQRSREQDASALSQRRADLADRLSALQRAHANSTHSASALQARLIVGEVREAENEVQARSEDEPVPEHAGVPVESIVALGDESLDELR